jgi:hypothetical protein
MGLGGELPTQKSSTFLYCRFPRGDRFGVGTVKGDGTMRRWCLREETGREQKTA